MTERREDLVTLLARENGKRLGNAAMEVDSATPKLRYNAALALTDAGHAGEVAPGTYSMTLRQPIGVAGVIVPWNSPVVLSVRSFAPALAAGCTVVMKLPAQTALTNGVLYEIIAGTTPGRRPSQSAPRSPGPGQSAGAMVQLAPSGGNGHSVPGRPRRKNLSLMSSDV
jgi:acyl-CoA reductase-like NAD-dependent aldehyde dehydrogenase